MYPKEKYRHPLLGKFNAAMTNVTILTKFYIHNILQCLQLNRPLVGFHHQALLIACFWPAGRGNIGYGANVGSNHTGKAPDQEFWAGEGLFIGLNTAIKYPSNFCKAPYSLIATGVTTLPQKFEFPFSLINKPRFVLPDLSPALNEVIPGWTLSDNLYMIIRGERKFLKRSAAFVSLHSHSILQCIKGTKQIHFEHEAFRPETVLLMIEAKNKLLMVESINGTNAVNAMQASTRHKIYTDKHIQGLGKNFLTEAGRQKGITVYSEFILFYAVRALWRLLQSGVSPNHVFNISHKKDRYDIRQASIGSPCWLMTERDPVIEWYSLAQGILIQELGLQIQDSLNTCINPREVTLQMRLQWVKNALQTYQVLLKKMTQRVIISKQKDDTRGSKIIDDYLVSHGREDAVIATTLAETAQIDKEVTMFIANLHNSNSGIVESNLSKNSVTSNACDAIDSKL